VTIWDGAHVVITGAAGAIGSALAKAIAKRGREIKLSLIDRTADACADLARGLGPLAMTYGWDLSKPEGLPAHMETLIQGRGEVNVLVNCAGIMEVQSMATMPWSLGERVLKVDLESPMRLMSLVVPSMVARKNGLIVNVSSMAGRTPLRGCTFYGAAKAGLAMASEIARLELEDKGVHVVTVLPGPVRSGLEAHARSSFPESALTRLVPTGEPAPLAARIVRACEEKLPRVVYPRFYDAANRMPALTTRATEIFSPHPKS
jgi:short-subunit dehydrogenase